MKTQIITLASHDDLVSVRDRMSWAKSPRILLVWPAHEQIPLRPLDLRILQQHAAGLGAQIGLVTRRSGVRHDAESFGIPVFNSTVEAQRASWARHRRHRWQRMPRVGSRTEELRRLKDDLRKRQAGWTSGPIARIGFFVLAVLAVFSIASLFVPRATVILRPITMEQAGAATIEVSPAPASGVLTGAVTFETAEFATSGSLTMRVQSQVAIPKEKATGIARFESVARAPLVIPAGTVVYSATVTPVRFATLGEVQLEASAADAAEVPIEALEPGKIGNVPADSIQGIEGSLGALATVTNPAPTEGGRDAMEAVPSQADREQLRDDLLEKLEAEAEAKMTSRVAEGEVLLPETLGLESIDQELFDPPAGKPASVLSLTMSATYDALYVRDADLRGLAEVTLDASIPQEYTARAGTLEYRVTPQSTADEQGKRRFKLEFERLIMRSIEPGEVNMLIRGRNPKQALGDLQASLPLGQPPELRLTPPWWPWLPLIPFRIDIVIA